MTKKNILKDIKNDELNKMEIRKINVEKLKTDLGTEREIRIDNPQVTIAKMQMDALLQLSDEKNLIFSEASKGEIQNIALALEFAADPLPSISQRLKQRGVDFHFEMPKVIDYITTVFTLRLRTNRSRTKEILEGLKSMSPRQNNVFANDAERQSLMQRLSR